jgi:hypothetical protein
MEEKILLGLFIIFMGLVVGDYLVSELKKRKKILPVDLVSMYSNIDRICLRHLDNLNFIFTVQNRKWISDDDAIEYINGITFEIYNSMAENFKYYCFTMVTEKEILSHITFRVTKYMTDKMLLINTQKK